MTTDIGTTPRKPMSQMRRLRIWEAHKGVCILCKRKINGVREEWIIEHVRALVLGGADSDENCAPAHEDCRRDKDKVDVAAGAKAKRMKARHIGIKKPSRMPGSRNSRWKAKIGGGWELRE